MLRREDDDSPEDLDRARAAVRKWREQNPRGTAEQLVADLGGQFHRDYAPVLRGVLAALELHDAKTVTGITITGASHD